MPPFDEPSCCRRLAKVCENNLYDHDPYDPDQRHDDPAVQELIREGWLGVWDAPISVADLVNAVRIVRKVDRQS
jgi:hypothetical protein